MSDRRGDDAGSEAGFSVGQYLRSQRVMRGIGLEELALRTRIPKRSLERLEAGAFDGEPDGFVRGFVRTVAEGLGLDPDDTLMRMLREPGGSPRRAAFGRLPRGAVVALLGLALVLAAGVALVRVSLREPAVAGSDFEPTSDVARVVRRDPVRALAEAQAASEPEPVEPRASGLRHEADPVEPGLPAVSAGRR